MPNLWFRMYSEFASDPKVQSMPESMQRRLVMIMCLRSCDVLVTLRDDEIAFALRISDEELAQTKSLFVAKKFIDESWNLLNWAKRQYSSDSSKERTKRWREKQRDGSVTASKRHSDALDTDTDTDTEQSTKAPIVPLAGDECEKPKSRIEQEFEEDWDLVWLKVGKGAARKAYIAARKKTSREVIQEAIKANGPGIMARAQAQGITPIHPATWFNQERFFDEPQQQLAIVHARGRQPTKQEQATALFEARLMREWQEANEARG